MAGLLAPRLVETVLGHAEVREIFRVSKIGTIAGCYVTDGKIRRNAKARLLRDQAIVFEGGISSLKRFKDDVREVTDNYECGIGLENFNDIKNGDVIEAYTVEEKEATL
jgi:translation initiation factor IF-2